MKSVVVSSPEDVPPSIVVLSTEDVVELRLSNGVLGVVWLDESVLEFVVEFVLGGFVVLVKIGSVVSSVVISVKMESDDEDDSVNVKSLLADVS